MNKAPFTEEQVDKLNKHQENGMFHPYTCDRVSDTCQVKFLEGDGVLIARTDGWICPCGKYKQDWCH